MIVMIPALLARRRPRLPLVCAGSVHLADDPQHVRDGRAVGPGVGRQSTATRDDLFLAAKQ